MKIKKLLYIPLIFYFLPAFVFFINERSFFPFLILIVPFLILLLLTLKKEYFIKRIIQLYKYTHFKYFCFLIIWIFLTSVLALISGYYGFSRFVLAVIVGLFLRVFLLYLYPQMVIPKYIPLKNIIKIFSTAIYLILLWGIIEFLGVKFNINIINTLVSLISNIRSEDSSIIIESTSNLPRIRSVFMEPGTFALFMAINLPIIYSLQSSKYKIFRNKLIDLIIKKTLFPLTWLCIFLTQSPIYLVICTVITIIFFYRTILLFIKKYFTYILLAIVIICLLLMQQTGGYVLSGVFLRIQKVISILSHFSLEMLICVEPSLATRVINNTIQFQIFLQHPFSGIGFGNNGKYVLNVLIHSQLPFTQEIIRKLKNSTETAFLTSNAMYLLLHQVGIIGFGLYCLFMTKAISLVHKVKKYFGGVEFVFVSALEQSILVIFSISIIYNQNFSDQFVWFYTGVAGAVVVAAIQKINELLEDNNETRK